MIISIINSRANYFDGHFVYKISKKLRKNNLYNFRQFKEIDFLVKISLHYSKVNSHVLH